MYNFEFVKTTMDIEVWVNGKFLFVIDDIFFGMTSFEEVYYYWKDNCEVFIDEIRKLKA